MLAPLAVQKTVVISQKPKFFGSVEFPTDLPPELTEIIDPYEFQQSIENINHAFRKTAVELIIKIIFLLGILIGVALTIIGPLIASKTEFAVWISILIVGLVLPLICIFFKVCVFCFTDRARMEKVKMVINAESMKYSTRRPIPTIWRLDLETFHISSTDGGTTRIVYYIIIDIGKRQGNEIRHGTSNRMPNLHEPVSYMGE
ncbi:hypothetical protein I4U23_020178 [Adineta vaga]|nr:hypothetical protein I4U23_020178 [Adineta vaga]